MNDKQLRIGTLTFSSKSKVQQAIATYLNGDRLLIMQALIDRFGFLALTEVDATKNELRRTLIEANAALTKAIEINHQVAAQHGITLARDSVTTPHEIPLMNNDDTAANNSLADKKALSPAQEKSMEEMF